MKKSDIKKEISQSELGTQRMLDVMGPVAKDILAGFEKISPDFNTYLKEFVWGDLYQRSGLDDKTRLVACFSALVGQGSTGVVLRRYIRTMMVVGWSKQEIMEIIILLIAYVGFPSAGEALYIAQEVFVAYEKDPTDTSYI